MPIYGKLGDLIGRKLLDMTSTDYAAEEFGTRFPSDVISSSAGQHARADHPLSMPQHTADAT